MISRPAPQLAGYCRPECEPPASDNGANHLSEERIPHYYQGLRIWSLYNTGAVLREGKK